MKKYIIMLFILFTSSFLYGDCELVTDDRYLAHKQYKEAQALYDEEKLSEAYTKLLESFEGFSSLKNEIDLNYECVNYVPGPYAPIISRSLKQETYSFDRMELRREIKHQLSPAPYVFIQYQTNGAIVSVLNTIQTSRHRVPDRLPLENFIVKIGKESLEFENVKVGNTQTKKTNHTYSISATITTSEELGFKLYK